MKISISVSALKCITFLCEGLNKFQAVQTVGYSNDQVKF